MNLTIEESDQSNLAYHFYDGGCQRSVGHRYSWPLFGFTRETDLQLRQPGMGRTKPGGTSLGLCLFIRCPSFRNSPLGTATKKNSLGMGVQFLEQIPFPTWQLVTIIGPIIVGFQLLKGVTNQRWRRRTPGVDLLPTGMGRRLAQNLAFDVRITWLLGVPWSTFSTWQFALLRGNGH